jgi:hypothetical protein
VLAAPVKIAKHQTRVAANKVAGYRAIRELAATMGAHDAAVAREAGVANANRAA